MSPNSHKEVGDMAERDTTTPSALASPQAAAMLRQVTRALRDARVAAGLSQEELAEFVGGFDRREVAKIENGQVTTQVRRLVELLAAAGLELVVQPVSVARATRSTTDTTDGDEP
jgi:ribosome-binding protein aMBF1 (putative translation factor)